MSALPENALTLVEQYANAKRGLLYNSLLWAFVGIAVLVALGVWTTFVFDEGIQTGRRLEKKLAADTPKPAPASCKNLSAICLNELSAKVKR